MKTLNHTDQIEALNTKLSIVQALRKLDWFLDGDEKFTDIYRAYQNIVFEKISGVSQQIIDAIKDFDYQRVADKMLALQSSNKDEMKALQSPNGVEKYYYVEFKRSLNAGLNLLMEGTKAQAITLENNIEIEEIKLIVENLKTMEKAKQFIENHLDAPNEIDYCVEDVKEKIEKQIKRFLVGVKALIDNHNFFEAVKKIDSITLVRILLGNQYTLNPPTDIFARFEQVNDTNPVYNEALSTIREKILTKFREELDKAKSKQPPESNNIHIRRFESAVKYLPEAMRSALEVELKYCKDDIVLRIRDNEKKLQNAFSSGDVKSMKSVLLECQSSQGMQSFINKGEELALRQIQEIVLKINQNFEHFEIREALTNVKKLYDYKIELEDVIGDFKRPYSEVQLRIIKIFEDAYLCFMNRFLNPNISMSTNESIAVVEKSFICLIKF
ncbi:unnamed protein product, partial [Rotaria sp. Silwood2]